MRFCASSRPYLVAIEDARKLPMYARHRMGTARQKAYKMGRGAGRVDQITDELTDVCHHEALPRARARESARPEVRRRTWRRARRVGSHAPRLEPDIQPDASRVGLYVAERPGLIRVNQARPLAMRK